MCGELGLEGLRGRLRIGGRSGVEGEVAAAERLWRFFDEHCFPAGDGPSEHERVLMEEAVTWRMVTLRLETVLGAEGLLVKADEGKAGVRGPMHPALEAMAKARERYRKVMKELIELSGKDGTGKGQGLAEIMAPILEKGKGVLEDAMEREAQERAVRRFEKKGTESKRNRLVDDGPRA